MGFTPKNVVQEWYESHLPPDRPEQITFLHSALCNFPIFPSVFWLLVTMVFSPSNILYSCNRYIVYYIYCDTKSFLQSLLLFIQQYGSTGVAKTTIFSLIS